MFSNKKKGKNKDIQQILDVHKNAMRAVAVKGGKQVHLFHDKSDILFVWDENKTFLCQ